jgi:hypothetical protein
MAYAINKFIARGIRLEGVGRTHARQYVELQITGLAADVALDVSGITAGALSTFWTQATADSAYGSLATSALDVIRSINGLAGPLSEVKAEQLLSRIQVAAAPATTQYILGVTNHLPVLTFAAANGPTTLNLVLEIGLPIGQEAYVSDLGA